MDWNSLNKIAEKILTNIISLESPINSFFENFWSNLTEWGFILIASVISAIVAIKIDRKFRDKNKIHKNKLLKETFSEAGTLTVGILFFGFIVGAVILLVIELIKKGVEFSPLLTLLVIVVLLIFWWYNKSKKQKRIYLPLKKWKEKKNKKGEEK